jgi:hypothetical protein
MARKRTNGDNRKIKRLKQNLTERSDRVERPPRGIHTCTVIDRWPAPDCEACRREFAQHATLGIRYGAEPLDDDKY